MSEQREHRELLRDLLEQQPLAVLGTQNADGPYTSLVGFAATSDLRHLLFATGRSTRKHTNLVADARASMLVDNRRNEVADFTQAAAATALGVVEEVTASEGGDFEAVFLAKHPHLEGFVASPSCVKLRLRVARYVVVTSFQHVIELHVDE